MPDTRSPLARTPLHAWHAAHGARLVERSGWHVVSAYSTPEREAEAARAGLGLADVSASTKLSLRGPVSTALALRGVALLPGPVLACRLTEDHLLLLGTTPDVAHLAERAESLHGGQAVRQLDVTSAYAGFCLVGPRGEEILRRLTQLDVRAAHLPPNACAETALAGVEALLVRSADLSPPAVRIYVSWDVGEYVWERLLEAGRGHGLTPLGLDALALCADTSPAEGETREARAAAGG
jgi:glycine cleavage system aminomethyltransferase T